MNTQNKEQQINRFLQFLGALLITTAACLALVWWANQDSKSFWGVLPPPSFAGAQEVFSSPAIRWWPGIAFWTIAALFGAATGVRVFLIPFGQVSAGSNRILQVTAVICLLVIVGTGIPLYSRYSALVAERDVERLIRDSYELQKALRMWAETHSEQFPKDIATLQSDATIAREFRSADIDPFYIDPYTGEQTAWEYFAGRTLSNASRSVLFASKPFPDQKRIVGATDFWVGGVSPSEYEKHLRLADE